MSLPYPERSDQVKVTHPKGNARSFTQSDKESL